MGDSGATLDPAGAGVLVAATPPGGVSPVEGVPDNDVDGAAGAAGAAGGEMLGRVAAGALGRRLGDGEEERTCAEAASGSTSKRATAVRQDGLSISIAITMVLAAVPTPVTIGDDFCGIHNLASGVTCYRVRRRSRGFSGVASRRLSGSQPEQA
jgi:hypothetical protein